MAEAAAERYHHGDLRAALLTTALAMLERVGIEELSLRALASAAGVSRAAPYAHFKDKRALLAAVAEVGFERMGDEMSEAMDAATGAREKFLANGRAYVRFAVDNANLFKLMFSAELKSLAEFPGLHAKSDRTYELFRTGLEGFLTEHAAQLSASVGLRTMAWSVVHGLSLLLLEERLPVPEERRTALVDEITATFSKLLVSAPRDGDQSRNRP